MGGAQACLGCRVQSRRAIIRNAHRAKVCQHDLDQFLMEYASEFELDCYGDVFHRSDLSLIPEASKGRRGVAINQSINQSIKSFMSPINIQPAHAGL